MIVRYYPLAMLKRIYYAPAMAEGFREALASADILHINGMFLWPGARASALARAMGVPYVLAPRGMLAPELIAGKSTLAKRIWLKCFDLSMLKGAAALHVTSKLEAKGIRALHYNHPPVHLIANGVDLPDPAPTSNEVERLWASVPAGHRVGFLARLDWKKGVDLAIKVVAGVCGAHLRIAGYDQIGLRARLERDIAAAGHADRIRFVGPLEGRDKWAFLAGADVLLVPSLNENFGNTVAEALAVGTSVVCTVGVGAGEIVSRIEPSSVVPRSVEALRTALIALLQNDKRRATLAARGALLIGDEYSWPALAQQMECVFQNILREPSPASVLPQDTEYGVGRRADVLVDLERGESNGAKG